MMSNTPSHQDLHGQGMETLSALFDGELHGDAARFAMKRLGHDPQWRQAVGNWQLLGDALRGQASGVAPGDFAARMAAAVSAESACLAAAAAPAAFVDMPAASAARRKWIGGAALAASVAMVAMFVVRPFSQDSSTGPAAATSAPTEVATAPAPAGAFPSSPDTTLQVGAGALAMADVPRRASARRSRAQAQRAASRAGSRQKAVPAIPAVAATGVATAMASVEPLQHAGANPFRPQHADMVVRPWPRAVLPASPASAAFTASYGTSTASSPSFYPFEPRLPNANDAVPAPVPASADERRR